MIVIIGAGPCGLGAARKLLASGVSDFTIFESNTYAGGLSASFYLNDFTWDIGGHVAFSKDKSFYPSISKETPLDMFHRVCNVYLNDKILVSYPFQNNLHCLPADLRRKIKAEILICKQQPIEHPRSFLDWYYYSFGKTLSDIFFTPYNTKVWRCDTNDMGISWMGDRVPIPDYDSMLQSLDGCVPDKDDWGPNSYFYYPKQGGTGAIWQNMADKMQDKIIYQAEIAFVDVNKKTITTKYGASFHYDYLISTMPINELIRSTEMYTLRNDASKLKFTSTISIGVGVDEMLSPTKPYFCWQYYVPLDILFYRVTKLSEYSICNAPLSYSSLLTEIAIPPALTYCQYIDVINMVITNLIKVDLLTKKDVIKTVFQKIARYGYPIPTKDRDSILEKLQSALNKKQIQSCGRFGAWKYEEGNMDHAYKQGEQAADNILKGKI